MEVNTPVPLKPSNYCSMKPLYTLGFLILSFFSFAQTPTIISNHVLVGNCTAVAYGNGVYVGSSGATYTSTNAKTWTLLNSDSVPSFGFFAFGNRVFVGVSGSSIYSSSNGTNWTYRADAGGLATEINFTHGVFYVVNGNAGIATSSDGVNWAALDLGIPIPTPVAFGGFDYNGSVYVIGLTLLATRDYPNGSSGVLYSTTGAPGSWTFDPISAIPPVTNVQWVIDRFYLFAQDGILHFYGWHQLGASLAPVGGYDAGWHRWRGGRECGLYRRR
jgi:hypothetical protein